MKTKRLRGEMTKEAFSSKEDSSMTTSRYGFLNFSLHSLRGDFPSMFAQISKLAFKFGLKKVGLSAKDNNFAQPSFCGLGFEKSFYIPVFADHDAGPHSVRGMFC
jgi:hypothetical protein